MKKNQSRYTTLAAFILGSVLPLATTAQKEFYGRPSNWRPYDQSGINVFETGKKDTIAFEGPRIRFGAGFTQQFQNLKQENGLAHDNRGNSVASAGNNKLYPLAPGFMTAMANLYTDIQLADGIRLNVTTYLSSRHHNEAWVKGGYIQFDKLPFKGKFWKDLMDITTIKVGHMEINYGDAHFRRSDGGQTLYNPFADNLIVDAYTTEIGGEVLLQKNGFFAQVAATNGMIKGNIDTVIAPKNAEGQTIDDNIKRNPSFYFKGGFDRTLAEKVRIRLSGSYYVNTSSAGSGNTLYWGDRTGSNYQNVMEKWVTGAGTLAAAAQASTSIPWSGRINPGFSKKVNGFMLNGFLKAQGLELFGTYEHAQGRTNRETQDRKLNQLAGEAVYRFGKAENLFVGARYNTVKVGLQGALQDVTINRTSLAVGWFVTKNVLMKGEYVIQHYNNFEKAFPSVANPGLSTDYRAGGKFHGYVIEAVVGF
jgi:hypothetical protein